MDGSLETRRSVDPNLPDIEELFLEAKHRWLSPAEICKILQNYEKLQIASEPSNKPPSGSLFLFDRRVTRNFRKDGHNWRRDHNGKLVKEGHKKLKIDSIDVLHCYYALGEENKNFRRHCYSMLEKDFSHIVLVHYLELTGRMEDFSCVKKTEGEIPHSQVTEKIMPNSEIDGSLSSGSRPNNCPELSENTDTYLNSAQPLERENARSAIPGIDLAPTQSDKGKSDNDAESTDDWLKYFDFRSWDPDTVDKLVSDNFDRGLGIEEHSQIRAESKGESGDVSSAEEAQVLVPYSQGQESVEIMPNSNIDSSMCPGSHLNNCQVLSVSECADTALLTRDAHALEHGHAQSEYNHQASSGFHPCLELRQLAAEQIDAEGSDPEVPLFYSNSFYESLSTTFGIGLDPIQLDMSNSDMHAELAQPTDDLFRTSLEYTICKDDGKCFTPCESIELGLLSSFGCLSQIQEKSKVSVERSSSLSESACDATSNFHEQEVDRLELMDCVDHQQKRPDIRNNNLKENHYQRQLSNEKHGYVLPPDSDGDSKFEGKSIYSSCIGQHLSDGLLTEQGSKKRSSSGDNGETGENENENDVSSIPSKGKLDIQDINAAENCSDRAEANLLLRFVKILWSGSNAPNPVTSSLEDVCLLSSKISSLLKGDNKELDQMLKTGSGMEFSFEKLKDQLLQKHLKEKLHVWILQKVAEGGNGPSILDEGGLGVLHLAAALGFDWALVPAVLAGVTVDFRDVNGWTALHWAAFCGREQAVASLISLGAASGASTDRSPKYPSGRTPTDLASVNGHKGIAGYLADRSSDVHIPSINLDHQDDAAGPKAVQKISEISAVPLSLANASDGQSQKDSLAPICDATTELHVLRNRDQNLLENKCFQPFSKKLVFNVCIPCDKTKQRCIRTVGRLPGVDSIAVKMKAQQMEVIGIMDPVVVLSKLRKKAFADIVSIGPATELNEGKRQDEQNERNGEEDEEEKAEDEGPEGKGLQKDKGLGKDEGPVKEKQKGKKRAPDHGLENEKAYKILKAYLAFKALLTAYYNVQSMEKIKLLGSVFVDALKKIRGRKLSHIDDGFEQSAIRV